MKKERRLLTNLTSFEWFARPRRSLGETVGVRPNRYAIVADGPARIARQSIAGGEPKFSDFSRQADFSTYDHEEIQESYLIIIAHFVFHSTKKVFSRDIFIIFKFHPDIGFFNGFQTDTVNPTGQ